MDQTYHLHITDNQKDKVCTDLKVIKSALEELISSLQNKMDNFEKESEASIK